MNSSEPEAPLDQLVMAIGQLLTEDRMLPGLILLYSAIDIFGSLGRPKEKTSATRQDFIQWVDTYLLPGSHLECTSLDLYAARCALVHTYISESDLSRIGKARIVQYDPWGSDTLQEFLTKLGMGKTNVGVPVEKLFNAFLDATEKFEFDVASDPMRQELLEGRVRQFYRAVPTDHFDSRLTLLRRASGAADVPSLEEFISASACHENLVVGGRGADGGLYYFVLGPSRRTDTESISWSTLVEDEILDVKNVLQTIQTRLKEAGRVVKYIDLDT